VVERVVEKPVPVPVEKKEEAKREPLRRDIFYTISSVQIPASEQSKVQEVADYLKKYPEAKVTVTGYADKGTGNHTINERLANNRANTVVNALVNQYGISKSRITSISKCDEEQPYAENDKNRVAICIAE
jgi:outer membrane protein OmpA-like peptidoglycan-associated protein